MGQKRMFLLNTHMGFPQHFILVVDEVNHVVIVASEANNIRHIIETVVGILGEHEMNAEDLWDHGRITYDLCFCPTDFRSVNDAVKFLEDAGAVVLDTTAGLTISGNPF